MSVYNGEPFLAEAIESVLGQTFWDFELLILDDGSSDSTPAILQAYATKDARIRPIIRENRGLIASLNQLLAESRAPLVARMDADDVCLPERFAQQIAFLNAHPDYGVVGTWCIDIDEAGTEHRINGPEHPLTHEQFMRAIDTGQPLLCHPAVMMRRDIVRTVGGYHAAFRHCEDYDLWLRLASVTRLGNVGVPLLRYRRYSGQVSNRHATEQHIGAAVALIAYHERLSGRPDPTEQLDALPPIDQFDRLFGRQGIAQMVRGKVARGLLYSRQALHGDAFNLLLDHVDDGGRGLDLWRTVPRLLRYGEPSRALRLATALALG